MAATNISISGLFLRRVGDFAVVEIEVEGKWFEVVREHIDGSFSHIVEALGMQTRVDQALGRAPIY